MASSKAKHVPPPFIPTPIKKWAPYFVLVLAVLTAWGNVYDNAFIYDDESLVIKNVFLRDWHSTAQSSAPL